MASAFGGSQRNRREVTPDVLPASQYLQEKLQERRFRNVRPKRARQSHFGPRRGGDDDDIFLNEAETNKNAASRMFDSSPLAPTQQRASDASDSGSRRGLGAKDFDERMDRLTKQNFALKLELDHRREHTTKLQEQIEEMQAQVDRAEQLEAEHAELLRINSQLVEELEKRDKAVEEAMDIICDLEDKVERNSNTRPSTANADSGYAGTDTQEQAPPSSPQELSKAPKTPNVNQRQPPPAASAATNKLLKAINGQTPAPRREPAILSQKKASTHALRSVYLETAQSLRPVMSFNSLLTKQESRAEEDEAILDSPRLSNLSESSFPSIYSPKKNLSPDRYAWEAEDDGFVASAYGSSSHLRQDSIKRVSQWMDERDEPDNTPSKPNSISPPLQKPDRATRSSPSKRRGEEARYQSLGNALSSASTLVQQPEAVQYIKPFPIRTDQHLTKASRPTSFAGPIFGEPLLPPTPDSASTRMLRNSRSSLAEDRSLLDTTPAAVKGYDALEPGLRTAPKQMRSSVELSNAYLTYLQRRNSVNDAQDESDAEDDDEDADSETARDLGLEYDGFPDGASLLLGTPSRFLKRGKPPGPSVAFQDSGLSPTESNPLPYARRQRSSEATVSPRKPSLGRAETSPSMLPNHQSYQYVITGGTQVVSNSVMSPRSFHSGSSSNKTVVHSEDRNRALSPDLARSDTRSTAASRASPPRSRTSRSPARTFGQKAHGLLRRMSNSGKDPRSEREKSPLPTLTSTPSSAYVNELPREARRPGTSHAGDATGQIVQRLATNASRPSLQARTNTAPASDRPSSPSTGERIPAQKEARNPFRRSNSMRKGPATPTYGFEAMARDGKQATGSVKARSNSIREAVANSTSKRPWR